MLILIPKYEKYIEHSLNMVLKLPKVEKYNIGNSYKNIIYNTLE